MPILLLLRTAWGWLSNPLVVGGIAIAALFAWHWADKRAAVNAARAEMRQEIEAAHARRRAEVAAITVDLSERATKLRDELGRGKVEIQTITKTLIQEVPRYVTPLADSRCVVPRGFVLHHDAAWAGRMPEPAPAAGGLVDEPSGVPLSRVESVATENAGACHDLRAEAAAWRTWYADIEPKFTEFARRSQSQPGALAGKPETKGR